VMSTWCLCWGIIVLVIKNHTSGPYGGWMTPFEARQLEV
jgi:hypothetical protein